MIPRDYVDEVINGLFEDAVDPKISVVGVGGAGGISRRHALAIVNRGGATAAEIVAFKNEIQQRVQDTFGIQLQPEPVFVGF